MSMPRKAPRRPPRPLAAPSEDQGAKTERKEAAAPPESPAPSATTSRLPRRAPYRPALPTEQRAETGAEGVKGAGENPTSAKLPEINYGFTVVGLKPEGIPQALKVLPRWMLWEPKASWNPKAPRTVRGGEVVIGSKTNADDYLTFEQASEWADEGYGLGFVLWRSPAQEEGQEKHLICLDLDGKLEDEQLELSEEEQAQIIEAHREDQERMIARLGMYAERSPSGRGVHIWFFGNLPFQGRKHGGRELYGAKRFMTCTGEHIEGTPREIQDLDQEKINRLIEEFFPERNWAEARHRPEIRPYQGREIKLETLLEGHPHKSVMMRLATEYGAWAEIMRKDGEQEVRRYPSQSEADFAFMNALARVTRNNASLMDHLFRQSALMRPKYEDMRGEMTNGEQLIAKAISKNELKTRKRPEDRRAGEQTSNQARIEGTTTVSKVRHRPDRKDD